MGSGRRCLPAGLVAIGVLVFLHAVGPVRAAAETFRWMRTYGGAANGLDAGYAVAVAADGSVYVTGSTMVEGQLANLLLRKYSATGAPIWMRTYDGASSGWDFGYGVAVAADGYVYVTGATNVTAQDSNLLLQKYTPAGTLLWTKTYNGAANGPDAGYAVVVTAEGSVYVAGATYVEGQSDNLLLRKYTPSGALLWMQTYNGADGHVDYGAGVAVATDDSVYVAGGSYAIGQDDNLLLRKYSPGGAPLWTRTYNGGANGADAGNGVAVAADGSVYVAGKVATDGMFHDVLLRKYSPSGTLKWMRTQDGAHHAGDLGLGVAVAANGNVSVTGLTTVTGQGYNLLLRKYSAAGAPLWMTSYNGPANGEDRGCGVALAADGSIYVAGLTTVAGQDPNLLLRKYK